MQQGMEGGRKNPDRKKRVTDFMLSELSGADNSVGRIKQPKNLDESELNELGIDTPKREITDIH